MLIYIKINFNHIKLIIENYQISLKKQNILILINYNNFKKFINIKNWNFY